MLSVCIAGCSFIAINGVNYVLDDVQHDWRRTDHENAQNVSCPGWDWCQNIMISGFLIEINVLTGRK